MTDREPNQSSTEISLAPLPEGVSFFDIDWTIVFSDWMGTSYEPPEDPRMTQYFNSDGTFDFDSAIATQRDWLRKYLKPNNSPNIEALVSALDEHLGSIYYKGIFFTIAGRGLDPVDQARIVDALIGHCNWLIKRGNFPELFACIEILFPSFLDSFRILEDQLPIVLRKGHIEKMPLYMATMYNGQVTSDNTVSMKAVLAREFPEEDTELLFEQAKRNVDAIHYIQTLTGFKSLPLKKKASPPQEAIQLRDGFNQRLLGKQ